jgi:polyvinyl alcohol dehydrogenase (cytochrome)
MRLLASVFAVLGLAAPAFAQDGGALYAQHCAQCHDAGQPRTPARLALTQLAPDAIVAALETGSMRAQGADRTPAERRALAVFLSGKAIGDTASTALKMCASPAPAAAVSGHWSAWGGSLGNDRFQRAANLKADDVSKLKLKWAFAFTGDASAAAQPSVVGDRVFVGSVTGRVYALSLQDGCAYWTFKADAQVRTSIDVGDAGGSQVAYFGDVAANVYAVDVATGALRWKRKVDPHIVARVTGTPRFYRGRVYVPVSSVEEVIGASPKYQCCTFRGSVVALDAGTGEVAWKTFAIPEAPVARRKNKVGTQLFGPSGAAIWSAPTIDEKLQVLYVATGDSYSDPPADTSDAIMAMDLQTGAIKWAQQMT